MNMNMNMNHNGNSINPALLQQPGNLPSDPGQMQQGHGTHFNNMQANNMQANNMQANNMQPANMHLNHMRLNNMQLNNMHSHNMQFNNMQPPTTHMLQEEAHINFMRQQIRHELTEAFHRGVMLAHSRIHRETNQEIKAQRRILGFQITLPGGDDKQYTDEDLDSAMKIYFRRFNQCSLASLEETDLEDLAKNIEDSIGHFPAISSPGNRGASTPSQNLNGSIPPSNLAASAGTGMLTPNMSFGMNTPGAYNPQMPVPVNYAPPQGLVSPPPSQSSPAPGAAGQVATASISYQADDQANYPTEFHQNSSLENNQANSQSQYNQNYYHNNNEGIDMTQQGADQGADLGNTELDLSLLAEQLANAIQEVNTAPEHP